MPATATDPTKPSSAAVVEIVTALLTLAPEVIAEVEAIIAKLKGPQDKPLAPQIEADTASTVAALETPIK